VPLAKVRKFGFGSVFSSFQWTYVVDVPELATFYSQSSLEIRSPLGLMSSTGVN